MRKKLSTASGVERTNTQETASTSSPARKKPSAGDRTIPAPVMPSPFQTIAAKPAFMIPAPAMPPIRACELLEGSPSHHVKRFQQSPPINAPNITAASITSSATIPVPTVSATCSPKKRKATKLKNAAQITAYCGRSTRVEKTVDTELAASCSPLRASNVSAIAMSAIRAKELRATSIGQAWVRPLHIFDDDGADLVGHILAAIHPHFEGVVHLAPDHEPDGVFLSFEQPLAALIMELIGLLLEPDHLLRQTVQSARFPAERAQEGDGVHAQAG